MDKGILATRKRCAMVVSAFIEIFQKLNLSRDAGFLVYGSFWDAWNDGASDLDAMLYFRGNPLLDPVMREKFDALQNEISVLYRRFDFLRRSRFFSDVFVLDSIHGNDGRFMIFDAGFIRRITDGRIPGALTQTTTQTKHALVAGVDFLPELAPVSLRHQDEFELAVGLHKLRNYLLFEIPKPPSEISLAYAAEVAKFFSIIPRTVAIILGERMVKTPRELQSLRGYLKGLNLCPLEELSSHTANPRFRDEYFRAWHRSGDKSFAACLECYERVLQRIVENAPMRSER